MILFPLGFLLAPVFFGIPGALSYFAAYKYLRIQMQLEPVWLETISLLLACIAGFTCIFMATRIINLRRFEFFSSVSSIIHVWLDKVHKFFKASSFSFFGLKLL